MQTEVEVPDPSGIVQAARTAGVDLWVEGARLRFRAPDGALTDELRQLLRSRRDELIAYLRDQAAHEVTTGPIGANQRGLWFLNRLVPDSPAYNVGFAARIHGPINAGALHESLQVLVDRHESLRTTYPDDDGDPTRRIRGYQPVDFVRRPGGPSEDAMRAAVSQEYGRPFDPTVGAVFRAVLFEESADSGVLLLVAHHLAVDGTSLFIVLEELFAVYAALAGGTPSPLRAVETQFGHFVTWQQETVKRDGADGTFWRDILDPPPPPLDLPADRPRAVVPRLRGSTRRSSLDAAISEQIARLSKEEGTTEFVTLLALWFSFLHRLTSQNDLTIGTPVHGRSSVRFERTVGDLINMVPLRVRDIGARSLRKLLRDVHRTTMQALAHQDFPLPWMTELAATRRTGVDTPFQSLFVLQDFSQFGEVQRLFLAGPHERFTFGLLTLSPFPFDQQEGQFDLSLEVCRTGDTLACVWKYDTDLFDDDTIMRRIDEYRTFIADALQRADVPIGQLAVVPEQQRALLESWNGTDREYPANVTLHGLIEAQAARTPHAMAVRATDGSYTYAQLLERAKQIATQLRSEGVRPGDRVGILLTRGRDLVASLLGVLGTGGSYVPLDPKYPRSRLRYMLEDSGSVALVTTAGVCGVDVTIPVLDLEQWDPPEPDHFTSVEASSVAYVIYTSGSTGQPKGVAVPHRALVNFLTSMANEPGFGVNDVLLAVTTISFDIAGLELYLPLTLGGLVVLAAEDEVGDGHLLAERMEAERVTTLQATPATWKLLLESGWKGKANLRALCGGEALPENVAAQLVGRVAELWNLYGPTETTIWSTCERVKADEPVLIGRPVANTTLYVLDANREQVPIGVPGELWIGGAGVSGGYVNRPELTADRFIPSAFRAGERLYRTGDLVRFRADGRLQHLGRLDDQVKVRGFRIELGEVEARLRERPDVRDAVVVAREDRLVAYVVTEQEHGTVDGLRPWMAAALPDYMVPALYVKLDALPLTPNGKVDRNALPQPVVAGASTHEYVAPRDHEESVVASIWGEILECENIGAHHNFFELGGHSLAAARVAARIAARFDVDVPLRDFFDHPTVAGVAAWIRTHRNGSSDRTIIGRRPAGVPAPLSFTQERLWFLQQLSPDSSAYNLSGALLLRGALDTNRLIAAIGNVVSRHEILRTRFHVAGEQPLQVVAPDGGVIPRLEDFSGIPAVERLESAVAAVSAEMERPYRLSEGPLLRAMLVRLDDDQHLFGLGMHHAISDQWSFDVLLSDIASFYNADGRVDMLPQLPLQYGDYAAWQRERIESGVLKPQLEYWTSRLEDLPILELPTDYPRPRHASSAGAMIAAPFSPDMARAVETASRELNVTPFVFLLSACNVLLYAYTRQSDFAVGTPIASRPDAALENLIGSFLNVVVHRADLSGDPSFLEMVARQRDTVLDAAAHQEVPFEMLVQALGQVRDTSRPPVFQVLFNLANAPDHMDRFDGLRTEPVLLTRNAAQFELSMHVHQGSIYLEYNSDLFERATAERLLEDYAVILEQVLADPAVRISQFAVASRRTRSLLASWNATDREYPQDTTLTELLSAQAARCPNAIAVVAPDSGVAAALTYGELDRRASALAARLQGLGVGPDMRVAVSMERSAELVVALVAVLKAGGAYVPIDPAYPDERRAFMLEDSGAPVVLTQTTIAASLRTGNDAAVLCVDEMWAELDCTAIPQPLSRPESLAYIIYTSGSTGRPKGAMIEHRSIVNRLLWMQEHFRLTTSDVVLQKTPYSFDVSVWEFFWPLLIGARVVMARPEGHGDPAYLASVIRREGVTTLHFVPSMLGVFLDGLNNAQLPSLCRVICSGEALSTALRDRCLGAIPHAELTNLYGPTEAAVDVSWWRCRPHDTGANVPIGWPVANTHLYILDERMQPLPVGVAGELYIGGVQVGRGYLNRPELTRERFLQSPFVEGERLYRTGDRARHLSNGAIEFLGRLDHQVKVRGFRIELGEVEARLREHPDVRDTVVVAREERLVAYVVARDAAVSTDELRLWMAEALPGHMVPALFVTLAALPLTASGKVDRKALPDPMANATARGTHVAPRDADEAAVASIWGEVLECADVGAEHNFFDLGGHSLAAARVVARIAAKFDVDLPLRKFFDDPTVAGIATWIRAHRTGFTGRTTITRRAAGATSPLSFTQERLWFLQQLSPESSAYNLSGALLLRGALDHGRLFGAIENVVRRHEVLRARIRMEGGRPVQVITPDADYERYLEDLGDRPSGNRVGDAISSVSQWMERPYRLDVDPMLRVCLIRAGDDVHVFAIGMHHAVSDMWSFGVLLAEITHLYNNGVNSLPDLPLQYGDFAAWQRSMLHGPAVEQQLTHWREKLEGLRPIDLPLDRPRPALLTTSGAVAQGEISLELESKLARLSHDARVTVFVTMLAAFEVLLYMYSRQTSVGIGVPVAARPDPMLENLVGSFLNVVVHRSDLAGNPTFRELLARCRETALDAAANQDMPFELLVQHIDPVRDTSRTALFQVLFNVGNTPAALNRFDGLNAEVVSLDRAAAQFELSLHAYERRLYLEYNTDLFDRTTAERLLAGYVDILERAVEDPDLHLGRLAAPVPDELALLEAWNSTSRTDRTFDDETPLFARIAASPERHSDRIIIDSPTGSFTCAELIDYAQRVTAALQALGVQPGDRVVILMTRSREMLGALLGVMGAGAAYVPIDPGYPAARVRYIFDDAGAAAVVTHHGLEQSLLPDAPILDLDRWTPPAPTAFVQVEPVSAAYVIYTSGSTGKPKGVEVSHGALMNFLLSMQECPGITRDDVLLAVTTISFDIAALELYLPILAGARVIIAGEDEALDGRHLIRLMDEAGVTLMQATPATWKLLIAAGWSGKDDTRILCGGEPLSRTLADELLARAPELWNMYGPTETTVWSVIDRVEREGPVLIGRPIANTTLHVLGDELEIRPIGVPGELYIGGAGVANGYFNRPDLTAERFIPSPFREGERLYRTGDAVRYRHDGRIEHLGRLDNQVKVRGFRIELGEVEAALHSHDAVRDAVVLASADRLIAYIVFAPGMHATITDLRTWVAATLPPYMVPSLIVSMDALPLTPNGKVDRKQLPDPTSHVPEQTARTIPDDPAGRLIAEVWSTLLGVESVGADDNFFEIGGHSLIAMEAVSLIEERTGHRLEPRSLFFMSLAELAATLPPGCVSA